MLLRSSTMEDSTKLTALQSALHILAELAQAW
jgi:hypothetical protein